MEDSTFFGKYLHNEKVKDCLKWRLDFVKKLTTLVDLIYDAICSKKSQWKLFLFQLDLVEYMVFY